MESKEEVIEIDKSPTFECLICIPKKIFKSKITLDKHNRVNHNIYIRNRRLSENVSNNSLIKNNTSNTINTLNTSNTIIPSSPNIQLESEKSNKKSKLGAIEKPLSIVFNKDETLVGANKYLSELAFDCFKYHNVNANEAEIYIREEIIKKGYTDELLNGCLEILQSVNTEMKNTLDEEKRIISNEVSQLPAQYQNIVAKTVQENYETMDFGDYYNFIKMHKLIVSYGEYFRKKNHEKYITTKMLYDVINNFMKSRALGIVNTNIPIKRIPQEVPKYRLRKIYYYLFYILIVIVILCFDNYTFNFFVGDDRIITYCNKFYHDYFNNKIEEEIVIKIVS